uniref:RRM domain-containing protein n=1 Tax=Panagrolaimus sp. ES5 TaxID=591445 RepID=A0AC34GQA1_9BILA
MAMGADMVDSTHAAILYAQQAAAAAAAAASVVTDRKPIDVVINGSTTTTATTNSINPVNNTIPTSNGGIINGHYFSSTNANGTDQATTSSAPSPNAELGELMTNLIINYLPQNMNQDEVRALLRQSLGYAFVNYVRQDDAKRAMTSFNGLRLQNKTIKVSYARPSNECIKGANLYVSGLPKQMTLKELVEIFRPFGKIITSRILFDNVTGLSKGVGFVRFDKKSEAEYAIDKVHGTTPPGFTEQIAVKFANSPGARDRAVLQQMATNLTNLGALTSPGVTPMAAAAQALLPLTTVLRRNSAATNGVNAVAGGPIRHTSQLGALRYSPLTAPQTSSFTLGGNSTQDIFATNAALLQMAAAGNAATQAQAQLAAFAAAGVPCSVGQSFGLSTVPTGNPNGTTNGIARSTSPSGGFTIIVANLGSEAEESILYRLFGPFGAVLSVKMVKDSTERCRGFGLITMANYEEAYAAVGTLNGATVNGRTIQVSFKNANPAGI